MKQSRFPEGWDEQRVHRILEHYDKLVPTFTKQTPAQAREQLDRWEEKELERLLRKREAADEGKGEGLNYGEDQRLMELLEKDS